MGAWSHDISMHFPHSLDILTCPWGPLLRGGGKGDRKVKNGGIFGVWVGSRKSIVGHFRGVVFGITVGFRTVAPKEGRESP
jgi:hypothetical protein